MKRYHIPYLLQPGAWRKRHGQERVLRLLLALGVVLGLVWGTPAQPALAAQGTWSATASPSTVRAFQSATLLQDGRVLVVGGSDGNKILTSAEIYNPATGAWSATGSLALSRSGHSATLLPNGKVLVTGARIYAELYDPAAGTWKTTGTWRTARTGQTATLLLDGRVLLAGGDDSSADMYNPATETWSATGSMSSARKYHAAALLPDGRVLVVGGVNGSTYLASAEIYDPVTGTWSTTGDLGTARKNHTATLLPEGKVLVTGGYDGSAYLNSSEIYNPATGAWSATGSLATGRGSHTTTLLPNGKVLVAGGQGSSSAIASSEIFNPATGTWSATGSLATGRWAYTTTLLPDGRVLLVGGRDSYYFYDDAEIYSPVQGSSGATGSMSTVRQHHSATLLLNGKVLVAGGSDGSVFHNATLASAEIYDPAEGTWSAANSLGAGRYLHSATLLQNGKVLAAGGIGVGGVIASAEIYDPATGTWSPTDSLATARYQHTATLLPDGKVLAAGGVLGSGLSTDVAEIYDPAEGTWNATNSMGVARQGHTATLLPGGKVLVVGGMKLNLEILASAEIYDPLTGTWSNTGSMSESRRYHTATLLPDGTVLVTGGYGGNVFYPASSEIYHPATGTWSTTGSMTTPRFDHFATLLPDGTVLAAGGQDSSGTLSSIEIFDPAAGTWSAAGSLNSARRYQSATLLPDGKLLLAGGHNGAGVLSSAERYDRGLGFNASWRPVLDSASSASLGTALTLGGAGWRGYGLEEASGGASSSSPTNYPLVQFRRLDNGQQTWLPTQAFSSTQLTTLPLSGFAPGPAMTTVFVNGIPSLGKLIEVHWPSLHLAPVGSGEGTVSSAPAGIDCGPACQADFTLNTTVTLTATPLISSTFAGWSGACSGAGSCVVTMTADRVVTATFDLLTNTITPTSGAGGSISPNLPQSIDYGRALTFTLAPDIGYHIADLVVDSVSQGALESYTFWNVTTGHTISASFALDTFVITPTTGTGGGISPNTPQTIEYGSALTFTVTPETGYHITDLAVDDISQGALDTYTFWNITTNHSISASFAINTYVITPTTGTGGGISPNTPQTVEYGDALTFTVTPEANYHVQDIVVDGVSQGNLETYTFWNVSASHTISAAFAINTFIITPTAGAGGGINPGTPQSVEYGSALTFTVTPEAGYHVTDVSVDDVSQGKIESYTFWNVSASHTISAAFAINTFIITPTAGAGGGINPGTPQSVEYGSALTFTVTPDTGYHIQDVGVDGVSQGALESYAFFNIAASHTISASFTPSLSGDSSLSALALSDGILAPAFAPATLSYTAQVSNSVISLSVTPTAGEAHAAIQVRVNGGSWNPVTSGSPSGALALNVGDNIVEVQVTAQDSTATTYTLTVTRQASGSHDSRLSALALSSGVLNPAFAPDTLDYTTAVSYSVDSLVFTPTASEAHAVLQLRSNGVAWQPLNSGAPSDPLPLIVGNTTLEIKVTAQDNITARTYTLAVARADRSQLVSLAPSSGSLAPPFNPAVSQYTLSVPPGTSTISLNLGPSASGSIVEVRINSGNWIIIPPGEPCPPLAVMGGDNLLEIRVTPPALTRSTTSAGTPTTYTILVLRPDPNLYYLPHLLVPVAAR